ncbi:MAG: hypothetical protein M3R53_05725 [Candidatus Eremiobacteraeota bacterium]|nr:hypothetical protein [Candidatus Eremiobacteraeota bacterium]
MKFSTRIATAALAGVVSMSLGAPLPAAADGGASTRNIIFGAAAIGGTLLIVNHNKKVHQKNAEYDQRQAQTQSEANQAQAAYESEKRAYSNEVALVREYQNEVAYQHKIVRRKDQQIASLTHSLLVAKAGVRDGRTAGFVHPMPSVRAATHVASAGHPRREAIARHQPVAIAERQAPAQVASYGWGSY